MLSLATDATGPSTNRVRKVPCGAGATPKVCGDNLLRALSKAVVGDVLELADGTFAPEDPDYENVALDISLSSVTIRAQNTGMAIIRGQKGDPSWGDEGRGVWPLPV